MKRALLAVLALAAGLGLGLAYAWLVSPVQLVNLAPDNLGADHQAAYIALVARAYSVDGDVERARLRLSFLGGRGTAQQVTALAQQAAAEGDDSVSVQALSALAAALGAGPLTNTPPVVAAVGSRTATAGTPTSGTPAATATPSPSRTPTVTPLPTDTRVPTITPRLLPTRTPTATAIGAFGFVGRQLVCNPDLAQPLIQVVAESPEGEGVPGVEVLVEWESGSDHFYTGLKPELGRGYGDFTMTPGVEYSVRLAQSPGAVAGGLTAEVCTTVTGEQFPGSWLLVFRQP